MSRRAVVVGAGIGGLAAARALAATGWSVEVFERAEGLPDSGTALGMWPEAMAALDRLSLGDRVRQEGVRQQGAAFLRPDGVPFARVSPREPAYLISRPALHRALFDGALEGAVHWGAGVSDPAELPEADLVVGADGINSRLRGAVAARTADVRPLGTVAFRGTVPGAVETVTETWGDGRLFGITPQDAETTNWFASIRRDLLAEYDDGRPRAELLAAAFGGWHPAVRDVLRKIESDQLDRRVLYDVPPLGPWFRGHRVIIGDAAHAMAPNAGRGACEAVVDAVELADSLASAGSVAGGLPLFDRRRRRAAQRTVRVSRLLNRWATARRFAPVRYRAMGMLARFA